MSLPFDPSSVALVAVAWAVTYAVHSTILLCGAWLLERRYADKPELMSPIWKAAVLGGALSATLQMTLAVDPAFGRWSVAAQERAAATPQRFADAASLVVADLAVAPVIAEVPTDVAFAYAPISPPDVWQPALASTLERTSSVATATPVVATESTQAARVALGLFALWIVGGLVAVIGLVRSWLALRRLLRSRVALHGGALADAFGRLRARAGGPRSIALSMSASIRVPLATGVVHPEIVVPRRAVAELAPSAQESMLAHELGHVVRRDPAWRLGLAFVQRVLFFQPLLGVAMRRITQHAEYLADAWAARHTAEPLALARCLTEIAAWVRSGPPTPEPLALASGMAEPASILGRRVLRLVEPPPVPPRRPGLALALACVAVPALAWIAPGASWAHDVPVVIANGEELDEEDFAALAELDEDDDVRMVVIEGGRAQGEHDALQHHEPSRAAAARSDDGTRKGRRQARKAERSAAKQKDAARREAEREIKQAFRTAKKRDELPDPARIAEIVARARADAHEDEHEGVRAVIVGGAGGERVVIEQDEHGIVVRKGGKVIAKQGRAHGHPRGKAKGHAHGHPAMHGFEFQVRDENGNLVEIRIPKEDIERIQRDAQREVERAMRELEGARMHMERDRARMEADRERSREQLRRHREFRGHAPRAPQPPPPPPRADIVPISPPPMPAPAPMPPPEAFAVPVVPFEAMPAMPVPELVPLAPAPPASPASPSSRRRAPRAAPKAPRARPDIVPVLAPSA